MITWASLTHYLTLLRSTFIVKSILRTMLLLATSIILLSALLSGLPVSATGDTQPVTGAPLDTEPRMYFTDTQVYTNELHHWSMLYPQDWSINDSNPTFVRLLAMEGNALCGIHSGSGPFATSQEFADSSLESTQETFTKLGLTQVVLVRNEVDLPSGQAAIDVVVEIEGRGMSHRLYALHESAIYKVDCETKHVNWPQFEPVFEQILRSFTLLPLDTKVLATPTATAVAISPLPTATPAPTPDEPFFDRRYDVEIEILPDGSVVVTETQVIEYVTGSYDYTTRSIPQDNLDYIDGWQVAEEGKPYQRVSKCSQPHQSHTFSVREENSMYEIEWCYPETQQSQRTFTLRYVIHGLLTPHDEEPDHLVLVWMAVPDGLEFSVLSSTVTVVAPPNFKIDQGHVVRWGTVVQDSSDIHWQMSERRYVVVSRRTIMPFAGLEAEVVLAPVRSVAVTPPITLPMTTTAPSSIALAIYTNTITNWAIAYPAEWSVDDSDAMDVNFLPDPVGPGCRVTINPPGAFATLQELVDDYYRYMEEVYKRDGLTLTFEQQEITLPSGEVGIEVEGKIESTGKVHALHLLAGRKLYILYCLAPDTAWPEWEAVFEQMIHSFTLLPQPVPQVDDAAPILEQIDSIRARPPRIEESFDADTYAWESTEPKGITFPRLEIVNGQAQVCSDEGDSGYGMWMLVPVVVNDFYAEIEVLNLGESDHLFAGMLFTTPSQGVMQIAIAGDSGDIAYFIIDFVNDGSSEEIRLAEDSTLMTEEQAEQLLLGVLVRDGEITLLINDEIMATVTADGPINGRFALMGGTPQGCYLSYDNLRLWSLEK